MSNTFSILWCDNIGATYLIANPLFHAQAKHVEIEYHFVHDLVLLDLSLCGSSLPLISKDQVANFITELLPTAKFVSLRTKLNVRELTLRLRVLKQAHPYPVLWLRLKHNITSKQFKLH